MKIHSFSKLHPIPLTLLFNPFDRNYSFQTVRCFGYQTRRIIFHFTWFYLESRSEIQDETTKNIIHLHTLCTAGNFCKLSPLPACILNYSHGHSRHTPVFSNPVHTSIPYYRMYLVEVLFICAKYYLKYPCRTPEDWQDLSAQTYLLSGYGRSKAVHPLMHLQEVT